MYDIILSVIQSKRYELTDMLKKIDTIWIQGDITDDQKTELVTAARENALPENTYAPLQEQVDNLAAQVADINTRLKALEGAEDLGSGEQEEWPPYVQPTGAHDAYNTGAKVTHNGQHYICQIDGCVWAPDVYPDAWELVDGAESVEKTA